jgi:hypothetical protein
MNFHGITMAGPFVNQKRTSLPVFDTVRDQGRLLWLFDGTLWYGSDIEWVSLSSGAGDATEVEDLYSDLLRTTIFMNASYDGFADTVLMESFDMIYSDRNKTYTYANGQYIESKNLFDTSTGMTYIDYVMVYVNYVGTGTPLIEVTSNGGTNWTPISNHTVLRINDTIVGTDLRIRFTGSGTGTVHSWGVLYNKDLSAACTKYGLTYKRFESGHGQTMFEVDYSPGSIQVFLNGDLMDETDIIATNGVDITFVEPLFDGDIVYVLTFTTSVIDSINDFGELIHRDGSVVFINNQSMGDYNLTDVADAINETDAVNLRQLQTMSSAENWTVVSVNTLAVNKSSTFVNTLTGSVTITCPASPVLNNYFVVGDYASSFNTNPCIINRNGSNIMGLAENMIINTDNSTVKLVYIDSVQGWKVITLP